MRKTQFALAAVALIASTAALAEGVTVYGNLDASVAKQSAGKLAFDGSGNWNGSNWGLRGSEDLDGGMKATFNVEQGLNIGSGKIDNGGSGATGSVFNRQANIGLSGAFGGVKLGLQTSPFIGAALNGVANGNESFYVPLLILAGNRTARVFGDGGTADASTGGFFIANAVSYTTPTIAGITGSVLTQVNASVDADKYSALSVSYAAGDLSVAAAMQERKGLTASKSNTITAAYQMGDIRLTGGFHTYNPAGALASVNTFNLGTSYNVAPNTAISLQYARNNVGGNAGSIINAGVQYSLSKTTYLYGTVSQANNGASALYSTRTVGDNVTTDVTGYAVGMVKSF